MDLLSLTLTSGLGPVLIARLLERFGSGAAALDVTETGLREIKGLGADKARKIAAEIRTARQRAQEELAAAERAGVAIIGMQESTYPALLREVPSAPPVLYVLGRVEAFGTGAYPVAVVGSRTCTAYGSEQAERFGHHLAQAGLTVVSGGARGIDTAAHRGALQAGSAGAAGATVAVLGCGLAHRYPPDNVELFDAIVDRGGALVSELPLRTPPSSENFPARNRIISGLSLGVVVIEAGRRSGALITAKQAVEEQGRDVFGVPGRVDSAASEGTLELLKMGGAMLVTHPADVIEALESPARHRFLADAAERDAVDHNGQQVGKGATTPGGEPAPTELFAATLSEPQRAILGALAEPATVDEVVRATGLDAAKVRAEVTLLEIQRRVRREGSRLAKA